MKGSKRCMALILTIILTISVSIGAVFAEPNEIDYSQWDTQAAYPPDIINTKYMQSVKYLIDKKILTGFEDGTFRPNEPINRAQIAVAVAKATNRTSNLEAMANKNTFADLSGYNWAKGHINALVDAGIIKGKTSTTYAPGENITYAELVTILVRMNPSAASTLEARGNWPDNYIQYVKLYNYLGDVTVKDWNAPAPRGDAAKLIYRFIPKN